MTHPNPEAVAAMIAELRHRSTADDMCGNCFDEERASAADLLAALSAERDALAERCERAERERDDARNLVAGQTIEMDYIRGKFTIAESDLAAARATIAERDEEIARLNAAVYVPGRWQCKKCGFCLMQRTFRASDGAVGVRDEPGEHCPNDGSPLWRVTEREAGNELVDRAEEYLKRAIDAEATIARLTREKAEAREALHVAVDIIMENEPGDSRAVSNIAVSLAAVSCDCANPEAWEIIRARASKGTET